ncbi:MAG: BspA family leucine-rich repeat surface protein, partial [Bacteroidales bacterium]|nr:BspA family leucine-rich repeat surface protein [Bacteroidales bacterium]
CKKLTNIDVSSFNTDNVTNMKRMFFLCVNLTSLDVSGFNTEKVTRMSDMFAFCYNLTSLDVSGFNTENVTNMWSMFKYCENLKTIYVGDGWNTSKVIFSEYMFNNCPNLVGGKGTKYDENHTNASYAHIDGGKENPGYFTKK